MEYFVISAKFVPLKYYTLSSQLQRLTSFWVGCSGRRILSPGQIAVMRKWSILSLYDHCLFVSIVVHGPFIYMYGCPTCHALCSENNRVRIGRTSFELLWEYFSQLCLSCSKHHTSTKACTSPLHEALTLCAFSIVKTKPPTSLPVLPLSC